MIYLASPYTSPFMGVQEDRYWMAVRAVAEYFKQGEFVYSPIVHCHIVSVNCEIPGDFNYWKNYNMHMIDLASELHVLCVDGWEQSRGVQAEILYAKEKGYNIVYKQLNMFNLETIDAPK